MERLPTTVAKNHVPRASENQDFKNQNPNRVSNDQGQPGTSPPCEREPGPQLRQNRRPWFVGTAWMFRGGHAGSAKSPMGENQGRESRGRAKEAAEMSAAGRAKIAAAAKAKWAKVKAAGKRL